MGEFSRAAEKLARRINESQSEGIHAHEIPRVVEEALGHGHNAINCYPSNSEGGCCETAWFISLSKASHAKGRGHLDFRQAMDKMIQHMQGSCYSITKAAILFTDSWDPAAYNDRKSNISIIKNDAHVEVYLMMGTNISEICL